MNIKQVPSINTEVKKQKFSILNVIKLFIYIFIALLFYGILGLKFSDGFIGNSSKFVFGLFVMSFKSSRYLLETLLSTPLKLNMLYCPHKDVVIIIFGILLSLFFIIALSLITIIIKLIKKIKQKYAKH